MSVSNEAFQVTRDKLDATRKAVRRFHNADTELRRAENAGDPERLNKAGTAYALAKINLFKFI